MISFSSSYFHKYTRDNNYVMNRSSSHSHDILLYLHKIAMNTPSNSPAWVGKIINKSEYDDCLSSDVNIQLKGANKLYNDFFMGRIERLHKNKK